MRQSHPHTMKIILIAIISLGFINLEAQVNDGDNTGWQKFQTEIGNKSIVGLGEVGHGYESFNEAKASVAGFLFHKMNFGALCFESSFTASVISYLNGDSGNLRCKNFLYPFWNTESVRTLLAPLWKKEFQLNKPLVVGFDMQEDCRFEQFSSYLIKKGIIKVNKELLLQCDSMLNVFIGKSVKDNKVLSKDKFIWLTGNYNIIYAELGQQQINTENKALLKQCIVNRLWLCQYLTLHKVSEKMYFRDSLMAENLRWWKNKLNEQDKLIIWGADLHISRLTNSNRPKWMGERLSSIYGEQYYAISFQKSQAKAGQEVGLGVLRYFNGSTKFNAIFSLKKIKKILEEEWILSCE